MFNTMYMKCSGGRVVKKPDILPTNREITSLPRSLVVSVGIHPEHADGPHDSFQNALSRMCGLLTHPRVKAVGEIGRDHSVKREAWVAQMTLVESILPVAFLCLRNFFKFVC